ncbi:MAG: hypothetical protein IJZ19_04560 [Lentisphaeria bacterium]|nr:hypothetical protein [Lentisphaeria bacterium]
MPVNYDDNLKQLKRNIGEIKYFVASGIPYYHRLMQLKQGNNDHWTDLFKEFYKIQGLTTDRRNAVFEYFILNVNFDQVDLNAVLEHCRRNITNNRRYDLSFISKLLHTYRPDRFIIYDKFVHAFFRPSGYNNKVELYNTLGQAYEEQEIQDIEEIFNNNFREFSDIPRLKKIDFMIWGWGKWKKFNKQYQVNQ